MNANRFIPVAIYALTCSVSTATAQMPDVGIVNGTGAVTLTRKPEVMRLQIIVQARGKIIKEALFRLKSRLESAREEVERLGAQKDSIKVAETRIMPPETDARRRQMQMQMRMMMMAQRGEAKDEAAPKNKVPPSIFVSAELSAEWQLKENKGDDLLIAVHALQEQIKIADLAGAKKDAEEAGAEEGRAEEGVENMINDFSDNNEQKPGEALFFFVCSISEDDFNKATAEAFQRATKDAARLAHAAGAGLGKLRSLNSSNAAGTDMVNFGHGGANMFLYRTMQAAQRMQSHTQANDPQKFEAIGVEPALIKHTITVMASFDIASQK